MSAFHREKVLSVRHWTDTLFSFTATRNTGFRFQNGQFAMIGLEVDGRPLMRAYSMASANHEEALEFFSIKVADGPLTSRLQKIKEGDTLLVGRKATGTLIADNIIPGKRLLLLSTGTGLAPFASLIKDPDVYEKFESIVLVHGCRQVSELAYGEELVAKLRGDELFGPLLAEKLVYYPTVTREPFRNRGRITDLITSKQLFEDIGQPPLDLALDALPKTAIVNDIVYAPLETPLLSMARQRGNPAVDGLGSVVALTLGFAVGARARNIGLHDHAYERLGTLSPDDYPHLTAMATEYAQHWSERAFEYGVNAILDTMEAARSREASPINAKSSST